MRRRRLGAKLRFAAAWTIFSSPRPRSLFPASRHPTRFVPRTCFSGGPEWASNRGRHAARTADRRRFASAWAAHEAEAGNPRVLLSSSIARDTGQPCRLPCAVSQRTGVHLGGRSCMRLRSPPAGADPLPPPDALAALPRDWSSPFPAGNSACSRPKSHTGGVPSVPTGHLRKPVLSVCSPTGVAG